MPDPVCEAIIFCDLDIIEAQSNKHTLVGIFDSLASVDFPFRSDRFSVHVIIVNFVFPTEPINFVLNIKNPLLGNVIGSAGVHLEKALSRSRKPTSISVRFLFAGVNFHSPGSYGVELLFNEELVGETSLEILRRERGLEGRLSPQTATR